MSKRRNQRQNQNRNAATQPSTRQSNLQSIATEKPLSRFSTPILFLTLVLIACLLTILLRRDWLFETPANSLDAKERTTSAQSLEGLSIEELEDKLAIPALSEVPEPARPSISILGLLTWMKHVLH